MLFENTQLIACRMPSVSMKTAAPFVAGAYPLLRVHQFSGLAELAFRTGHPYWGWRFAGWALHYVQDLTQPYHARVLPGVGVTRMLWVNAIDMIGIHGPKNDAVTLVSNRHTAIENYQYGVMRRAIAAVRPPMRSFTTLVRSPLATSEVVMFR